MDSEKMNQLSKAIEAKLSGILPEIEQLLQEHGVSEPFEIVFTTNSVSSRGTGACFYDPEQEKMVCDRGLLSPPRER